MYIFPADYFPKFMFYNISCYMDTKTMLEYLADEYDIDL